MSDLDDRSTRCIACGHERLWHVQPGVATTDCSSWTPAGETHEACSCPAFEPPVPMPYDGPRIVSGPGPLGLDAIDPRKATPGQVADLIALVRAKESWIDGAKVDMAALEEAAAKATTWHMEALDDLAACVAERDEVRAEVERLRTLADDNWRSLEREATEHARTLGLIGQPKTGEPLSEGEQRRFEAAVERGLRKRAEDQRDDWRRRYEALRDGVTGLCDERDEWLADDFGPREMWPTGTVHTALVEVPALRAVVARVEGDES